MAEGDYFFTNLILFGSFVVAFFTGFHALLLAFNGIVSAIQDFLHTERQSDLIIKPTPDEIVRYSVRNHDDRERDERSQFEREQEWRAALLREIADRNYHVQRARMMSLLGFMIMSFMTVAIRYFRAAADSAPWSH